MDADLDVREDTQRLRPADSEVMRLVCDATRLRAATGWARRTPGRGPRAHHRLVFRDPANLARYKTDIYNI